MSSQRRTSARTNSASPLVWMLVTAASPRCSEYSPTVTCAPSRANAVAIARPLPEPAPVTIATRPSNRPTPTSSEQRELRARACHRKDELRALILKRVDQRRHGIRFHLFSRIRLQQRFGRGTCRVEPQRLVFASQDGRHPNVNASHQFVWTAGHDG